ncbi:MAG: LytTR family DNA-binding domain-containing protein [Ignavibacteriaceae bacterium]
MKDQITALIIDDEKLAREITKSYLRSHPEIEIAGESANGFDAVKKINQLKPDLIFLDIQMPKLTGFEMLELIENPPVIIFTTAYDNFAIRAFEVNAIDYLLKPFSQERFDEALGKAVELVKERVSQNEKLKRLLDHSDSEKKKLERVVIKKGTKITVLPVEEIKWIQAQDDYVRIHTSQDKYLKQKPLKFYEKHLDQNQFIRIHRSHIINTDYINHLEQTGKDSYKLILKNNAEIPVSRTGLSRLKSIL